MAFAHHFMLQALCLGSLLFPSSAWAATENSNQLAAAALTVKEEAVGAQSPTLEVLDWAVASPALQLPAESTAAVPQFFSQNVTVQPSNLELRGQFEAEQHLLNQPANGRLAEASSSKSGPSRIEGPVSESAGLLGLQAQGVPQRQKSQTPLQLAPSKLFNLETANQQPPGTVSISTGVRFFFTDQVGFGTGLQVYNAAIDGGVTDRLQLGLATILFDDRLPRALSGQSVDLQFLSVAPNFKYQLIKDSNLSLGLSGSLELLQILTTPGLLNPTPETVTGNHLSGTLQVPLSYALNPELQVHFTPGVAFYPETINATPFFGTILNLGAGLSWQPLEQVNLFADLNLPLSGGNAISSQDSSIFRQLVWSAGLRYLVNPDVGLDVYATNAFGTTPATRFLSFVPDGDQTAIGVNLNYTPDFGQGYASSFRKSPTVQLGQRDAALLLDGLTLTSADTLLPGMLRLRGGLGAGDGLNIAYGLTNDFQVELIGEQLREGKDLNSDTYGPGLKLGPAVKLRFLDQVQGDPFSLGLKVALGLDLISDDRIGLFSAELPFLYRLAPQVALSFNPKAAFVLERSVVGAGLGVNYGLSKDLQLIGEFTPLFTGQTPVWSVGARYFNTALGLGVDVYGSNAIGQYTLGGLVAQSDNGTSVGFNLHWLLGGGTNF